MDLRHRYIPVLSFLAAFAASILAATIVSAHSVNQSYIYLDVTDTTLSGKYEAAFEDLIQILPLDSDGDGVLSEEEILDQEELIFDYFQRNFLISADGQSYEIASEGITFLPVIGRVYAQVNFTVLGVTDTPEAVDTIFTGMFDVLGDGHAVFGILASNTRTGLENNESQIGVVYGAGDTAQTISLVGLPWYQLLSLFAAEGIWHILLGFDHVLFLCVLMIPATMIVADGRWQAAPELRAPFLGLLKLVTVFTLANALALTLAALEVFRMPGWLVEALVALLIATLALTILVPRLQKYLVLVVVAFGLLHGFDFATVLAPINIEPGRVLLTLAGFSLGVEIGQIAVILLVFPILFLLRNAMLQRWGLLRAGSVVLIVVSLVWFEERAFDLLGPVGPALRGLVGI